MPDYSKCIIYTIRTPTGLYVGATCNFINRKYQHNICIHNENSKKYNIKLYKNIRDNNDEWEMKPHSEFPCKNKMEMNIEEERIRRELNADLNSYSCYGFNNDKYQKEYYQNNKEKIDEYQKEYYQNNKETKAEYQKEYYQNNKKKLDENGKQYYENNKEKFAEQSKQYRENNKEKVADYQKEYQKNNKEKVAEQRKQYYELNKEKLAEYQKQYYQKKKAEKLTP